MGLARVLVSRTVFKTAWEARAVSGGFDSHTVPPLDDKEYVHKSDIIKCCLSKSAEI